MALPRLYLVLYSFLVFIGTLILLGILAPILLLFAFLPLIFLRLLIARVVAPYLRPDLGKILSTSSTIFAAEDLYSSQASPLTVTSAFIIRGKPSLSKFREEFQSKAISQGNYPELRQNVVSYCGYLFWRDFEDFKLEEHIYSYKEDPHRQIRSQKELLDLMMSLCSVPWRKDRALWEIIFLPLPYEWELRYGAESLGMTVALIRVHHALADGFSQVKLFTQCMGLEPDALKEQIMSKGRTHKKPIVNAGDFMSKFLQNVLFAVRAPYDLVYTLGKSFDRNEMKLSENELRGKGRRVFGSTSESIPLEVLKKIKKERGVSLSAVVLGIIAGGMRELLLEKGSKLPDKIHVLFPLPLTGHPDKLRNHMTMGLLSLPVGEADPLRRLQRIHQKFERLKRSSFLISAGGIQRALGVLPKTLVEKLRKLRNGTVFLTNFPGPATRLEFTGCPVEDVLFTGNPVFGTIGIAYTFTSYMDEGHLSVGGWDSLLPDQAEWDRLLQLSLKQLKLLQFTSEV